MKSNYLMKTFSATLLLLVGLFFLTSLPAQAAAHKATTVIKIGLNLPLSGINASLGQSAENGALLAIDQANAANALPGHKLQLVAKDDANASGVPDATIAQNNVQALIKDAQVAAILGAFDTTTAEAELPIANKAPIALLSPSATYTCLTQPGVIEGCGTLLKTLQPTGKTTFFRLAATDTQQGEALTTFALNTKHYRRVWIIDDTSTTGVELANVFSNRLSADGGIVAGRSSVPPTTTSFIALLTQIAASQPDVIFYAGNDGEGATIRQQMLEVPALKATPLLGGSGIHTTPFANTQGTTQVFSAAPSILPASGQFVQQYQAKYNTLGTYSAAGYDSVNILVAALKTSIAHKVKVPTAANQTASAVTFRKSVLSALLQTRYTSVTGLPYTFTPAGDLLNNQVEIDQLSAPGQWQSTQIINVTQGQ